jgi:hypothetical protein
MASSDGCRACGATVSSARLDAVRRLQDEPAEGGHGRLPSTSDGRQGQSSVCGRPPGFAGEAAEV